LVLSRPEQFLQHNHPQRIYPDPRRDWGNYEETPAEIARDTRKGTQDIDDWIEVLPVDSEEWQHTYKGERHDHKPVAITWRLRDLGACVLAELLLDDYLQWVMVLVPGHRSELVGEDQLERLAPLLPTSISGRLIAKMRAEVPAHRGHLVFQIMPRPVIKAEPAATRAPHLTLMRVGLRWPESRDEWRARFTMMARQAYARCNSNRSGLYLM
jgi:hypothetical protein